VNYDNAAAPSGTVASVKIGEQTVAGDAPDAAKAIAAAIKAHGYPAAADPNEINYVMTVVLLTILVIYVAGSAASCRRRHSRSSPPPATSIRASGTRSWWHR
jgi:hypothetical protein